MIDRIDRASQLRREQPIFHILHFRRTHHEAAAMDVYDDGQWVVGGDRAIRQNSDRLCAKGTLDMNFVSGDIRQVRYWNGAINASALARRCLKVSAVSGGSSGPCASASRNSGSTSSIVLMYGSRVRL